MLQDTRDGVDIQILLDGLRRSGVYQTARQDDQRRMEAFLRDMDRHGPEYCLRCLAA